MQWNFWPSFLCNPADSKRPDEHAVHLVFLFFYLENSDKKYIKIWS
jgi:hypothetical protein